VPFTPVTGRRLLAAPGPQAKAIRQALAGAIVGLCDEAGLSSAHFNFLEGETWEELGEAGLALREDQQFHWINRDYRTFDDFLAALSSRKRKMIRKERQAAQDGLVIRKISCADQKQEHWDAFFKFYMDTGGRKWGSPYLNRDFFRLLHDRMADRCLLVLAYDGARPIAGALNMIGSDTLYGRYWGRTVERPFLHFEVCYYQAIDFAIERGLKVVEAGAQGEHKLARGYEPRLTRSAHWFAHEGLRHAVARYLDSERATVEENIEEYGQMTPFKKDGSAHEHDEEGF
jgi:predicted N-acyltransferase